MDHPLLALFIDAATGRFPPVDGGVTFVEPLAGGLEAVVGFTGHAVIASRFGAPDLADLALDGFGRALHPETLLRLAGDGIVYSNDLTLVSSGLGPEPAALPETTQWDDHDRVALARSLRADVVVHGDETGFVTLGAGLGGRTEMGIEVTAELQGSGAGAALIEAARHLFAPGQSLFAAVAPGNARSLRAFLAQGFTPIATEVIIAPR